MKVYRNDVLVKTMNISTGSTDRGTPTHLGPQVISAKPNPYEMNSCTYDVGKGPATTTSTGDWTLSWTQLKAGKAAS